MEQFKNALRALTQKVCHLLDDEEIPKRPIRTVVNPSNAAPHVAMDESRPALADLRFSLSMALLRLPEYDAAAKAVEDAPELREGIVVDAGGFLREPERTNITRALLSNFLWRYLREGTQLDWKETRFVEIFGELMTELRHKIVVFHTTLPLSNLKMDIAELDFGDGLKLLPASPEELERWISPDSYLLPLGGGPPQWPMHYVDRPAVLHARRVVVGQPRSKDPFAVTRKLPQINANHTITSLRLIMNAPISVIFHEDHSEGLMAFSGRGTSWGWPPPPPYPVAVLDQEKAAQVIQVWQRLQTSPNIDRLRLSLRRWESSMLRSNLEDRLIDAWISMESLLLARNEKAIPHTAVRLAKILGLGEVDRKTIDDTVRIAYRWRNAIVHSDNSERVAIRMSLQDAVQFTTEYLRSALLKVLDHADPFDPRLLKADLLSRESGST